MGETGVRAIPVAAGAIPRTHGRLRRFCARAADRAFGEMVDRDLDGPWDRRLAPFVLADPVMVQIQLGAELRLREAEPLAQCAEFRPGHHG